MRESGLDETVQTTERVPERNVGAFAGWPTVNDFFSGHGTGIMHCCTGNGTRALYYVWEHALTFKEGELCVNLLLNRPSRWADVHSYIPYEGQVDVHLKRPCTLKIRIPEWVTADQVDCLVDGLPRRVDWSGRYAGLGDVLPGQVVRMTFPIQERVNEVDVEKRRYVLVLKGNTIVHVDPPGRFCPFYQRDAYRDAAVRWKKATRFVAAEEIYW